jgi:hypothetical protein
MVLEVRSQPCHMAQVVNLNYFGAWEPQANSSNMFDMNRLCQSPLAQEFFRCGKIVSCLFKFNKNNNNW